MKPEGSLPHSQMPATCRYPEHTECTFYKIFTPLMQLIEVHCIISHYIILHYINMWLYVSTNYMVILRSYEHTNTKLQLQLDVRGSVHHSIIHIENPTRCNSVSKILFNFIWSFTCFGQHTAHHLEPKTALVASGFSYVEGCWPCSCQALPVRQSMLCLTAWVSNPSRQPAVFTAANSRVSNFFFWGGALLTNPHKTVTSNFSVSCCGLNRKHPKILYDSLGTACLYGSHRCSNDVGLSQCSF
jgi:hypothetical protein